MPDPVKAYLRNRGITVEPLGVRYHPNLPYWHEGKLVGTFPAMIAEVVNERGILVTVHRTWLTPDGQKAPVPTPRKLLPPVERGSTRGCAVRLAEPGHRLAVAEGIESALAFQQLTHWATWATVSAGGMASVIIPSYVEELLIAADNDASGTGLGAAKRLARRLLTERPELKIQIKMPPNVGEDWNDVLRRRGDVA